MRDFILSIFLLFSCLGFAQLKPIGSWTDHLPYNEGVDIATDGKVIFCATTTGLFTYNTEDNSIEKFSKVNLLSDVELSKVAYSEENDILVIAYANANIDLIKGNRIVNIPFIKLSDEIKQINDIQIFGNIAYLSTAFGITLIDLIKDEIVDTYRFGPNGTAININGTVIINDTIYAASDNGIFFADINNNLLDFNVWQKFPLYADNKISTLFANGSAIFASINFNSLSVDSLFRFNGSQLIPILGVAPEEFKSINTSGDDIIYSTSSKTYVITSEFIITQLHEIDNNNTVGYVLIANRIYQLNRDNPLLPFLIEDFSITRERAIRPNGPANLNVFDIDVEQGVLWAVNGGHNSAFNNNFNFIRLHRFDGSRWESFTRFSARSINGAFDGVSVNANPNNRNQVFFGLWGRGLAEFTNATDSIFSRHDHLNSEIRVRQSLASDNWSAVGEGDFDEEGNFWFANAYTLNGLGVVKTDGTFKSFNLSNLYTNDETATFDVVVDDNGYKWLTLPLDNEIVVYDDNGTIDNTADDRSVILTSREGNGSIPGARGIKIEKDNDGLIWIGTSDGIAVHFNPGSVFDGNLDFERIIFFDGENNEIVLSNTVITDIAIDGFNRKWIGTENSGVILLSEDGRETVQAFDENNSPLISNAITAISIDDISGEVFFGTANGIVSFRGDAVSGSENFSTVSVFPNPVKSDFSGNIIIKGLIDNSTVKITDVNGTLINELRSQGGQALWDGNNFDGRRAATGVYLLFISAEVGTGNLQTEVGKIMFLR